MRLRDFELLAPDTVEQASTWLAQAGADGQVIAGGTDLIPAMKERLKRPRVLVDLAAIPHLDYIRLDGSSTTDPGYSSDVPGGLRIGALTRLNTLARSPIIGTHYPLLAQAARAAGSPHIRNLATIGGNICLDRRCWYYNQAATWREARPPCFKASGDACYVVKGGDDCYSLCQADLVPPLLALEAMVIVVSPEGATERPLAALYPPLGFRATTLEPGEVVTEIRLPPAPATGVYVKYAVRPSVDFPLVSVAALLAPIDGRVCGDARIVIGGVTPAPVRATQAEALLRGQVVTSELLEAAAEAALKAVKPIPFIHQSVADRRQLTRACLRQALRAALTPTGGEGGRAA